MDTAKKERMLKNLLEMGYSQEDSEEIIQSFEIAEQQKDQAIPLEEVLKKFYHTDAISQHA